MGNKIALMLSLVFVSLFFLLGGDLISLQFVYSDLDAKGTTISYYISKTGRMDDNFITEMNYKYHVKLAFITPGPVKIGDVVDYTISESFDPLIMSNSKLTIKVQRSTVIGYF